MSLSKEAKVLREALQAAGVEIEASAPALMVAAAKFIEERNANILGKAAVEEMVVKLAKLPAGGVVEPKLAVGMTPKFGDPFIKKEGSTIDRFTGEILALPAAPAKPTKPAPAKKKTK